MSATFTPRRRAKDCIYWVAGAYGTGKSNIAGQESNLVVNKKRVEDHAEIYTPLPIVKMMYKNSIDSAKKSAETEAKKMGVAGKSKVRFVCDSFIAYSGTLEPSCGSGNFLEYIIREKLKAVFRHLRNNKAINLKDLRNSMDALVFMILSVNSLFGLELQPDNVIISRNRVFIFIHKTFRRVYDRRMKLSEAMIFAYLLRMQIQHDNALLGLPLYITLRHVGGGNIEYYFSRHNIKDKKGSWERRDMNGWVEPKDPIEPFKGNLANMRAVYQDYLRVYYEGDKELHDLQNEDFARWGFVDLRTQQSGYQAYIKHKPLMDEVDALLDKWNKDVENILRDKGSAEQEAKTETKKQYIQGSLF